ncbi:HNH endonuclease [Aeromonas hydrophila]|uniref:HNH endonuclease n=1 Tax=Aeromonas hydrophila TaxID=644 RepID=UPI003977B42C
MESACRVTGVTNKALLIASHIKPWSKCVDNEERLNGHNGLLPSPHINNLFDHGMLTFSDTGVFPASPSLDVFITQPDFE